ncbi:RNA-directed DNA polymerase, eukaryota, Reverse transcriptase zinc-binding domain protein [Artemisia annua]|uniref:RNA-directed DNA polymerase, eukaryota, Reverse transcriptase zinc-binding domain protein n=1 Tax=Artemisia annua TaxID=35608 RepID=A0A2U1L2S2_ARTAN|nr:RNA-directed DNA polymerase, eukaryota, Reverse transcriptase zinc-binding domain protein [Artemisia annua]
MTDQVVHTFIRFKAYKEELFCSFVYAHNRYTHRRRLWDNLGLHNQLVRNRPWCVLGDFNSALNLEDKVEGSSIIDIAMREFKECVDANELVDINRSGLQFTWSQKPRGLDGTLRKIDRIMANLRFLDSFAGAHAVFQPYRVSDHSLAILHIPTICKFKPRPFKFSNILVQNSRFKQQVQDSWCTSVSGFHMFKVVSKLKALKKPFRSMLFREENIHEKVTKLRHELDVVQRALDLDPFNVDLREEEACYLNAFNEAVLKEECFLKQKAKVEWLQVGDSNSAYFHKVVKSRKARSRIDLICDGNGVQLVDDQVPNAFVSYFTSFLGQEGPILPLDDSDLFTSTLDHTVALYMVRDVMAREASAWFDKWCSVGPLSLIVSSRDIHRAGFSSNSLVRDIIS